MAALESSISTLQFMLFLVISSSFAGATLGIAYESAPFNRSSFPPGFVFGAASAAYQYEGAAFEGGKGPSIWDTFTHKFPDMIADKSNGDVANDFYHRYKDDVKLLKYIGLDAFRLSISWPRILPRGKRSGGVNKEGIAFYNKVFDELLANGITPFVTLFHWDLPQALEDEYRGFLSPLIVGGYDGGTLGNMAPGRCSPWAKCPQGNSATEPYVVGHHMLLCHAVAVKLYKEKYKATQKGEIGITLVSPWFVPYSNTTADAKAAQRALDFMYGWFIHPVVYGKYPKSMQLIVGNRLPQFTDEQTAILKGSYDFLGLNYYTGNYAAHLSSRNGPVSSTSDKMCNLTADIKGVPIGDPTGVSTLFNYPQGLHNLLVYTKEKYNNPTIYITENGIGDSNNATVKRLINDPQRIDFYNRHLHAIRIAITQGVNVKGFIAWSFLDNFEWKAGYTTRFGLCFVDYKNGLKRIPKQSALWFKKCLSKK